MKKITTLLFVLTFTFTLTACGEITDTPVISSTQNSESSDNSISEDTQSQEQNINEVVDEEAMYLDLENDYLYLNMTMEEADELFGEPLMVIDALDESGYKIGYYRTYELIECVFYFNENEELYLFNVWIFSPEFAPVCGIKVGDSLESVREKIPLGKNDYIKKEGMYRYYLTENMIRITKFLFAEWSGSHVRVRLKTSAGLKMRRTQTL